MDTSFFRSHTAQVFRAQGAVEMVLLALTERGLEVSGVVRERVESCEDRDLAREWLVRALRVTCAEDIFENSVD